MADGIEFGNGDSAGIPDTTTLNTRFEDQGPGARHTQAVRLSLGRVDAWNGEAEGTMADPYVPAGAIPDSTYNGDQDSPVFNTPSQKGALIWLEVVANPGGGETLTVKVLGISPVSGNEFELFTTGVLVTAANGLFPVLIYPGTLDADFAGKGLAGALPRDWKFRVVHSGAGNWEYSASATFIP